MKTRTIAALLLSLVSACGGSSDPKVLISEGQRAQASGNYADAAESYEKALAALGSDSSSPEWKRAKLGLIGARVRIDAAKAKDEFLQLASANPGKITDSDFNDVVSRFGDAEKFDEAIAILKAGKEKFPESKHLDDMGKALQKQVQKSGNKEAAKDLEGLGYAGGDE